MLLNSFLSFPLFIFWLALKVMTLLIHCYQNWVLLKCSDKNYPTKCTLKLVLFLFGAPLQKVGANKVLAKNAQMFRIVIQLYYQFWREIVLKIEN